MPPRVVEPGKGRIAVDDDAIATRIYVVRGQRVMLDVDLAVLYGVPTKRLNEQVRRNLGRFPSDFLFQLTEDEVHMMRSQIATASSRRNVRFKPYVFTEHGVTMLSAILNSERAVEASVAVVRAFIKLRQMLASHVEPARRLDELERKYDGQFAVVFDALRALMSEPAKIVRSHGSATRATTRPDISLEMRVQFRQELDDTPTPTLGFPLIERQFAGLLVPYHEAVDREIADSIPAAPVVRGS